MSSLKPYSVGLPTGDALRLHLNEYRFEHPPEVVAALEGAAASMGATVLLARYPDDPAPLRRALAAYVGCAEECVAVSAGSDEVLRAAIDTARVGGQGSVVVGVPTYTHFAHFAKLSGIPIHEYSLGLGATAAAQTALMEALHRERLVAGALVYVGNPNNPTGCTWDRASVRVLAERYPNSLFLVDEAYTEFVAAADCAARKARVDLNAASLASLAVALPNVVVARTLSKAFGLAALRVGYAVGQPATVRRLALALSPKAVGRLAVRVGCAALARADAYAARAAEAGANAHALSRKLRAQGWWVQVPTGANFFLVHAGDAPGVVKSLRGAGIAVRDRSALPCLDGFLRVTAGTAKDGERVAAAFGALKPPARRPLQLLYTPKDRVAEILGLYRRFRDVVADSCKFPLFWLACGTLLGWARHGGGLIPWDDDIDLGYVIEVGERDDLGSPDAAAHFRDHGLTLQRNRTGAYWQVGTNEPGELISPVHIDLFPFRPVETSDGPLYTNVDPRFSEEKPDDPNANCDARYRPDELFPLRSTRLYSFAVAVPARAEEVLARALGPDYAATARVRVGGGGSVAYPLRDLTPA